MSSAPNSGHSEPESGPESGMDDVFIYSRVSNLPPTFGKKDPISACLMRPAVFVYATHSGIVHMCSPNGEAIRTVRVHRASVLDVDSVGKYVATASIDGTIVIASIDDPQDTVQASFRRPVHCIALNPDYANQKSYVSGGTSGQVVLSERGWLKNRKDTVLVQSKSTILELAWINSRILFCNEDGISIFNSDDHILVNRIARQAHQPIADLYRPRISFYSKKNMAVVAWAKFIYIVNLVDGQLIKMFTVNAPCAGVHVYNDHLAVLLISDTVELKLVDFDGNEVYDDELELKGGIESCNSYHLQLCEQLFIVSSQDVVRARERTVRDHYSWLLEHQKYADAYLVAKTLDINNAELTSLGTNAASQLLEEGKFGKLSELLPEIITDKSLWLKWASEFLSHKEYSWLAECIPPQEMDNVHQQILEAFISTNEFDKLQTWLKKWPVTLYDGYKLAELLQSKNNSECNDTLVDLYLSLNEYVLAVKLLVKMDSARAYDIVKHYHLWTEKAVLERLPLILTSGDSAFGGDYLSRLQELINQRGEIPPAKVIAHLTTDTNENDLLLFGYLSELGQVDDSFPAQYSNLMVKLYSKYDPKKLFAFLTRYDTYDIDSAIKVCKEGKLNNELVYLLGQIGEYTSALDLIVTELHDFKRATEFTRVHEIWDKLLKYTPKYPELVLELLTCVEISPTKVLDSVPQDLVIKGLKSALCKVIAEQDVSIALSEGSLRVIESEAQLWTELFMKTRLEGTELDELDELPFIYKNGEIISVQDVGTKSFAQKLRHLRNLG